MSREASGHLAMLVFSALVAGTFALVSQIANEISPTAMNALRFWLAAIILGICAAIQTGLKPAYFKAPWRYLVLAAAFMLYFVMMFEGLKTASAVSTAAVFTLTPILTAGFGYLLLRQVLTTRMAIALLVGGIGALWVIFRADLGAFLAFDVGRGEAIYFVGVVSHAAFTPLARKLNRGEPVLAFNFGVLLVGSILLAIVGWRDVVGTDWTALRPQVWITIAYVTIFASAITTVLLMFATLRLPSAKVMAYTYMVPSWVMVWELALGGTLPAAAILVGVGLTVIALVLLLRSEPGSQGRDAVKENA